MQIFLNIILYTYNTCYIHFHNISIMFHFRNQDN